MRMQPLELDRVADTYLRLHDLLDEPAVDQSLTER